jgi:NADP-dependent 3-hydroxy acid dehydrogenase YdfG
MASFQNKTVIVTGAGTGIGRAVVAAFVAEGARVALIGRREAKLAEAAAGLPDWQVMLCPCDVADRDAVNVTVAAIEERLGACDVLVNNAGLNTNPRAVGEVAPEDWDLVIDVNLTGVFNMTRAALPGMRARGDGTIINVASTAGLRASAMAGAAYSASKHAVVAFTNSLNEEELPYGLRASAVCPGEVNTPILDKRVKPVSDERRAAMLQSQDVATAVLFVAGLPQRASVPLLVIKPMYQIFA